MADGIHYLLLRLASQYPYFSPPHWQQHRITLSQSMALMLSAMRERDPLVEPKIGPVSGKCALHTPMMEATAARKRSAATTHPMSTQAEQQGEDLAMTERGKGRSH